MKSMEGDWWSTGIGDEGNGQRVGERGLRRKLREEEVPRLGLVGDW